MSETLNAIRQAVRAGHSVHLRSTLDERDDGLVIDVRRVSPSSGATTSYRRVLTQPEIDALLVGADQVVAHEIEYGCRQLAERRW